MTEPSHDELAAGTKVRCAVVTVSDTRTYDTDASGKLIVSQVQAAGHEIVSHQIVPDEPSRIAALMDHLASSADVVVFNGGTGISKRDTTYEAVAGRLEKTLPGFGEVFRMLSFEDVGPRAILSRAIAGVYKDTVFFSIPGSTPAVQLALESLIVPLLEHAVWEILRQKP